MQKIIREFKHIFRKRIFVICFSILVVAVCGIVGSRFVTGHWIGQRASATADSVKAPSIDKTEMQVPPISQLDYVDGQSDAPISIIEYSDLECPYCKKNHSTLVSLQAEYPGKIRRVFRNLPLASLHPMASEEARFALCVASASGEKAYYRFISNIFGQTTSSGSSFITSQLADIGASVSGAAANSLIDCSLAAQTTSRLNTDLDQAKALGLTSTPSVFILTNKGNYFAKGAYPLASYRQLLEQVR